MTTNNRQTRRQLQHEQPANVAPMRISARETARLLSASEVLSALAAVIEARPTLSYSEALAEALAVIAESEPSMASLREMAESLFPGVDFSAPIDTPDTKH